MTFSQTRQKKMDISNQRRLGLNQMGLSILFKPYLFFFLITLSRLVNNNFIITQHGTQNDL